MTRALIVHHCHFLVNTVLNQRVHNRPVGLSEKLAGVMRLFGYYDEAVVVQHVTVEIVGCARFLASGHAGTLNKIVYVPNGSCTLSYLQARVQEKKKN